MGLMKEKYTIDTQRSSGMPWYEDGDTKKNYETLKIQILSQNPERRRQLSCFRNLGRPVQTELFGT